MSAFALAATSFGGGKWGCGKSAAPAIQMDPDDHADTGSHGSNPLSRDYRLDEVSKIGDGSGFMDAFEKGANDVIDKFGSKYADAVDLARTAAERYFQRCGPGPGGAAA